MTRSASIEMRAAPRGMPRGAVVTRKSMGSRKHWILVVVTLAGVALSGVLAWKNFALRGTIETLEASLQQKDDELQRARSSARVAEQAPLRRTGNPADGKTDKVAREPAAPG